MDRRVELDVEAINRTRDGLFRAFNSADIDGFMAPVADDVVWMGHHGPPPTLGKEAVRSSYKAFFERGPFIPKMSWSCDEVIVAGDWALDRGTWAIIRTYKRDGRRERLESCYFMIWRRYREGHWKLARFIWNGTPVPLKARRHGRTRKKSKGKRRR